MSRRKTRVLVLLALALINSVWARSTLDNNYVTLTFALDTSQTTKKGKLNKWALADG